jgi:replication-associated recombination protein RarA
VPDEQLRFRFGEQITPGGYRADEVTSALQKEIRRGNEREALFWATELDLAGYGAYAWRRLRIICSEDVGLADPMLPAVIHALHSTWLDERKKNKAPGVGMLQLVHATLLLARAPKSRIVDNAANVMYAGDRAAMAMVIPDFALDQHTARGRAMGRTEASHYDQSYGLVGQALDDPFEDEARRLDGAGDA